MPNGPRIWSTISRCCPVATTRTASDGWPDSARTTGSILIASGRVPRTTRTRSAKGELLADPADGGDAPRFDVAGVLLECDDVEGRPEGFEHLVEEIDLQSGRQIHAREERELPDAIASQHVERVEEVRRGDSRHAAE